MAHFLRGSFCFMRKCRGMSGSGRPVEGLSCELSQHLMISKVMVVAMQMVRNSMLEGRAKNIGNLCITFLRSAS